MIKIFKTSIQNKNLFLILGT